jgi:phosphoglycerate dehydrogenase-like enzyme
VTRVLVTMPFSEAQLERIRKASPRLAVTRGHPAEADYSGTEVLYAGTPPHDLARAPDLRWVQLHMAGVNALQDHPLFRDSAIPLTTTSGVHAATIAEYAITMLLALAPAGWYGRGELSRMLPRCDAVVLCAPLTRETRHLIDRAAIGAMKSTAYLVNVGRGATVDEAALACALAERRIAGAAIDVFVDEPPPAGHPFYDLDNVILSPHVSGFLPSYDDRCVELFAENLRRYLAGAPLLNLVDRTRGY